MRLLCDENIVGLDALTPFARVRALPGRDIRREHLRDADVLWVRSITRVDEQLLAGTPVRCVGTATAGVDHVDQAYLAREGIGFHAAPGSNANAVTEYVLSALAELASPWERLEQGGCLGVIGFGHVGRRLVTTARDLGWQVRVYDPWVETAQGSDGDFSTMEAVLGCDVVTVHCDLHERSPWPSVHLLDREALETLTGSQWLINAARGPVVDNTALRDRLYAPDPPGVVLDVWEHEPSFDAQLLDAPGVLLGTPHIAGYSWDAKWEATCMLARDTLGIDQEALARSESSLLRRPVTGSASSGEFARELLRQRYDIAADDRALRSIASLGANDRGKAFDQLRRDYAVRRELRGSELEKVAIDRGTPEGEIRVIRALGVLERETRFELATSTLARLRSTN